MQIEPMTRAHADAVRGVMRVFYASPAVLTDGSPEIFENDIEACVQGSPYLEGFVFVEGGAVEGYAMAARSFSTEYGRPCVWVEDLYLTPRCRGRGFAGRFFAFLQERYPGALLRLEVERENGHAVHVYQKNGFTQLPYMEMKKLPEEAST